MFTVSLAYIKYINSVERLKDPNFVSTWFDGFYFNDEMALFKKNIKWLREQTAWKKIAYIGALGTSHIPIHFFAIYLDVTAKKAFIYNSQIVKDKEIFTNLKNELCEYNFIENNYSNQIKNSLCGFFALNFLEKMIQSRDLLACFNELNIETNRDDEIREYQKKSVLPLETNVKLLHIFLENWKTN